MVLPSNDERLAADAGPAANGNPPTILHARVVSGPGGGPEKTILSSPRFLERAGYRAICAYMRAPRDPGFAHIEEQARRLGAPLVAIDDRGPLDVRVVSQLLRLCRRERVAIWHGHDYKSNALGLLLRKFWPMRLATTVHGWVKFTRRTPLYYGIDRFCLRHYDRVICVSEDLHERALALGVPANRCLLVHNAIDTGDYTRRVALCEAKKSLGIPPERLLVGAVGRLSAEKGFDTLIRAVDRLIHSGLDMQLVILGEGDAQAELQRLIESLGRSDRIRLLGYCLDARPWYEALDAFALSSLREGLPNVLLEAMALEVPVVATRVAGVPSLVHDEESGLLVEPGSVEALAAALRRLLADAELRARLAAAGRREIESHYSFAFRMQKIAAIYDDLLGRRPAEQLA